MATVKCALAIQQQCNSANAAIALWIIALLLKCSQVFLSLWYFPLAEVRKKLKMFSHTLVGSDKLRLLAGGEGFDKHIFVVARQSLTAVPTHPAPYLCKVK